MNKRRGGKRKGREFDAKKGGGKTMEKDVAKSVDEPIIPEQGVASKYPLACLYSEGQEGKRGGGKRTREAKGKREEIARRYDFAHPFRR